MVTGCRYVQNVDEVYTPRMRAELSGALFEPSHLGMLYVVGKECTLSQWLRSTVFTKSTLYLCVRVCGSVYTRLPLPCPSRPKSTDPPTPPVSSSSSSSSSTSYRRTLGNWGGFIFVRFRALFLSYAKPSCAIPAPQQPFHVHIRVSLALSTIFQQIYRYIIRIHVLCYRLRFSRGIF